MKDEKEFDVDIDKLTAGLENTRNIKKNKKLSFKFKLKFIIIIVFVFVVVGFTNSMNSKQEELRKDPWAKSCNPIENFEYTIEDRYIRIDEYIGKDKRVRICKNYLINDVEFQLTCLGEEVFTSKNIFSVLFPNSIESLPSKIFYKSKVKYIYLPKSLNSNEEEYQFSHYLRDVEKIYFEGSRNDFELLTDFDKEISENVKEIIYECKYDDLNING